MMIEFMLLVETEHGMFLTSKKLSISIFRKTEICSFNHNDDTVNMKIAEPSLNNYRYYPELFIVDSDFCTKK